VQVYIAGFSRRTSYDDIKDLFRKFGKIRDLIMKERYAFVVRFFLKSRLFVRNMMIIEMLMTPLMK